MRFPPAPLRHWTAAAVLAVTSLLTLAPAQAQAIRVLTLGVHPQRVLESAGPAAAIGTVVRDLRQGAGAIVVRLHSSNSARVQVPVQVTIPEGQHAVNFPIGVVDTDEVEADFLVTLSASASGYVSTQAGLVVGDDNAPPPPPPTPVPTPTATPLPPALSVSLSGGSTISEAGGVTTGTVTRSYIGLDAPMTVNLSSSDSTEATVPAAVVIPAGSAQVDFTVTAVDDNDIDGNQRVLIGANKPGLQSGSAELLVTDDDNVPTLLLSLSQTIISENGTSAIGTVTRRATSLNLPMTVTLAAEPAGQVALQPTVLIPAGQAAATFVVRGANDDELDGTVTVTISASKPGFRTGQAALRVTDNEVPTLRLSLETGSIREDGTVTGTVTRLFSSTLRGMSVTLSSSDPTEAWVQPEVVIPAGETTATFTIRGVMDDELDGTRNATITASKGGFVAAQSSLQVTDADVPAFTLILGPGVFSESAGTNVVTFVLERNTPPGGGVTVLLSSSDTSELTVPASVVIPAGATSVTFQGSAVDDAIVDGPQQVTVTASHSGMQSGTAVVTVNDDD